MLRARKSFAARINISKVLFGSSKVNFMNGNKFLRLVLSQNGNKFLRLVLSVRDFSLLGKFCGTSFSTLVFFGFFLLLFELSKGVV
jgi:hypothetical protein